MSDLAQYILSGLSVGCVIALVALGFVIIANVTGVYNFAQGQYVMVGGMVAAWSLAQGLAWPLAVILSIAIVAAVAVAQERITVAPVRGRMGPLGLVVASLGVAVILDGLALLLFGRDPLRADLFVSGNFELLGARLKDQVLLVWGATAAVLAAVIALFYRTHLGRAMRAVEVNPVAARLVGIRVGPLSAGAFAIGGALAGMAGAVTVPLTLVAWDRGIAIGLAGFIAAALAGFSSPARAVLAGLALGVVESLAGGLVSSSYRLAFVYGVLLVFLLSADLVGHDGVLRRIARGGVHLRRRRRRRPRRAREGSPTRRLGRVASVAWGMSPRGGLAIAGALALAACFPLLFDGARETDAAIMVLVLAIGATGLTLIMGLAGQLSLGQGAFYLVGGYAAGILTANHAWGVVPALLAGVALASLVGLAVGLLTVRLRGFNLALATLAVQLILVIVVSEQEGLTGGALGIYGVPAFTPFGIDLSSASGFYYAALACLAGCLLFARGVSRSRIGLGLRALGTDQDGAEALGVRTMRLKVVVFAIGSAMGGLGGVLWVYWIQFADPSTWGVGLTIDLVTFVVIGGLTSVLGGAVGAVSLEAVRYGIGSLDLSETSAQQIELILTGVLLIAFVLVFRAGITGLAVWRRWLPRERQGGRAGPARAAAPPPVGPAPVGIGESVLEVAGLSRRFGGFLAVDDLDFELRRGEVTALIGPNGAGKSTVVNLLSGALVPSEGRVTLEGERIDGLHPDEVARRGLVRTFQTPCLFTGLSVAETVMLAGGGSPGDGPEAPAAALAVVGLEGLAGEESAAQPAGRQRLLDLARALAAEPTVLLLDEPAAGLNDSETESLGETIRRIAAGGTAVLLVEHAVGLVMSVADSVMVLDQGRRIAAGAPEDVGRDQRVIDAYLGAAVA